MSTAKTTILLIEDNPGDARLITEALSEAAEITTLKLEIAHCETLAEALKSCSIVTPDVILSDLGLPDAQGLEAVECMRRTVPQVPIVVLTVRDEEELAVQSLHRGAQDYLPKAEISGALVWRALRYAMERQRVQLELVNLALIDDLTGLHNRRGFMALAEHYVSLANRSGMPFLVAFIDLDGLKQINDTFGHQEGNRALVEAAGVLQDSCRQSDILARLGGDEFAILVADVSGDCTNVVHRRIQEKVDSCNRSPGRRYALSLSIGIVWSSATESTDLDQLLREADALMYAAKQKKKTVKRQ